VSTATPETPSDEAGIERVVREILFPLDQELELSMNWGCSIFGLVIAPGGGLLLWLGVQFDGWSAFIAAFVASFVAWIVVSSWFDEWAARRAARTFNGRFPEGHPSRAVAIQMLSEMECPNKAQDKLREAIQRSSPNDRIRRNRREDPEQALQTPVTPQPTVTPPATPTPTPAQPTTRPGFGAFESIPLDINDPDKDRK
jgi:hypothetical protein